MSIEGGNRQEACTEISMEAITDKTRHCAFFVRRLIFAICPPCNPNPLITSADEYLQLLTSHLQCVFNIWALILMLRFLTSSDTNIFVLFTIMKRVLSSLQSPIRAWPIRRRVKHKKQTHYIRITSVLCCITRITFALHLYYATSRHMSSISKRQIATHCKPLSPHLLSSSEISDYLWNIRTR